MATQAGGDGTEALYDKERNGKGFVFLGVGWHFWAEPGGKARGVHVCKEILSMKVGKISLCPHSDKEIEILLCVA